MFCRYNEVECSLFITNNFVAGTYNVPPSPYLIIGEAPGEQEVTEGRGFVGQSGQELANYFHRCGVDFSLFDRANVVKCRPPANRDPKKSEIEYCSKYLLKEILERQYKVIVACGRFASQFILDNFFGGFKADMEDIHGIPYQACCSTGDFIFIPCYHPSYGLHDSSKMTEIGMDIRTVADIILGKQSNKIRTLPPPQLYDVEYKHITNPDALVALADVYNTGDNKIYDIAIDTESIVKGKPDPLLDKPWCITFSFSYEYQPKHELKIHKVSYLIEISDRVSDKAVVTQFKWFLETCFKNTPDILFTFHNALYDLMVLKSVGIDLVMILGGDISNNIDCTMIMAYLLQYLPRGLKPLAYRFLDIEMPSYEDVVYPYANTKTLAYLEDVQKFTWKDPDPFKYVDSVTGAVKTKKPQNIAKKVSRMLNDLRKDTSLDLFARWIAIKPNQGRAEVERAIGELKAPSVADIPFKEAIQYAGRDSYVTLILAEILRKAIQENQLNVVYTKDIAIIPFIIMMQETGMCIDIDKLQELSGFFEAKLEILQSQINDIYSKLSKRNGQINPNSPPQVAEALYNLGLFKTPKQSTDVEALDKHKTHPLVDRILEYREYQKFKSTYTDSLLEKIRGGRVYTHFKNTHVVTGRLASYNPNLMNQPTRSADGKLIRKCFIAAQKCKLVAFDYSQIEMRVAAHVSQDATMLKLFREDKDLHAHTASWIFKIPLDKVDKDRHRYPAKRVGFGILYCLSAQGLQKQLYMEGMYYSKEDCQGMIDSWFAMYPGVASYMKGIESEARRFGRVRDMFGRYRLAPEMHSAHKWIVRSGIRKMSNAPIQMGAQGIIKRAMADCYVDVILEYMKWGICKPLLQVHDELIFEVQSDLLIGFVVEIKKIMENCVKLAIDTPVDVKIGDSWGTLIKHRVEHYYLVRE